MTGTEIYIASILAICSVHTCYVSDDNKYMQIDAAPLTEHPDDTPRFYHGDQTIVIVPEGQAL